MFSANENILLRQHKKRIVEQIESMMPEEILDLGTTVMVMQVSCKSPGCVPLETAIIVIFPDSPTELLPGLPESKGGGSYKTKILKPMADVQPDDILDALPPAFRGGKRTMAKLCTNVRDVMFAQITQLFGGGENDDDDDDDTRQDRQAMAEYLQTCLQDYINRKCRPPEWGEPFPPLIDSNVVDKDEQQTKSTEPQLSTEGGNAVVAPSASIHGKGNFVMRRPLDAEPTPSPTTREMLTTGTATNTPSSASSRAAFKPRHQAAINQALNPLQSKNNIAKLFEREHAPGIRRPGCPCCDPDNVSNLVDNLMSI